MNERTKEWPKERSNEERKGQVKKRTIEKVKKANKYKSYGI